MIAALVYALTAIALVAGAWAARGLYRELASDLCEDLAYAGRRFRGLRIVFRRGSISAASGRPRTGGGALLTSRRLAADLRSTSLHQQPPAAVGAQQPPITFTTKGGSHGRP